MGGKEAIQWLREKVYEDMDEKTGETWSATLEQLSFRWLAKVMTAYAPEGCLTDVANLVFAMTNGLLNRDVTIDKTEQIIADRILKFGRDIDEGNLDRFWIPTHYIQDAESDDFLAWLLLERVHKLKGTGTRLQVLIMFPPASEDKFDVVQEKLVGKH